jgi:hypothetical protein
MGWTRREVYRVQKGNPLVTGHLYDRVEDNTQMNYREISCDVDAWMELAQCRAFICDMELYVRYIRVNGARTKTTKSTP